MRGYPIIEGSNVLAVEMLEPKVRDTQRDDPCEGNRFWCSPDDSRVGYDAICYSCENTLLHFRFGLGDWRGRIMFNTKEVDARLRPGFPYAIWEIGKATEEQMPESGSKKPRATKSVVWQRTLTPCALRTPAQS